MKYKKRRIRKVAFPNNPKVWKVPNGLRKELKLNRFQKKKLHRCLTEHIIDQFIGLQHT